VTTDGATGVVGDELVGFVEVDALPLNGRIGPPPLSISFMTLI
jgi:hypothetical protein